MTESTRNGLAGLTMMGALYLMTHFNEIWAKLTGPSRPPATQTGGMPPWFPATTDPAPASNLPGPTATFTPPAQTVPSASQPTSPPYMVDPYNNILTRTNEQIAEDNRKRNAARAWADTVRERRRINNEATAEAEAARAQSRIDDAVAAENRRLQREATDRYYETQRRNREAAEP